ncbi:hypothetical protein [Legionella waltersii]|uniref:Uncharacterized protein n=1 Tax=Legionella waltersii TaxID=66969 RepID=A0A0W1A762_9GAMM|nr:hypothetical protein [Legionella waltersii]KTD77165.1 hypothetical protein Lwal_1942 [Legionella waltersii]SNV11372.1 Uncharacterised protein [Legionella waltersii]
MSHYLFMLSLIEDDNLFQAIMHDANSVNLKSAIFTRIGALSDITMGFYHGNGLTTSINKYCVDCFM